VKTIVDTKKKTILRIPDQLRPALCVDLDGTIRYSKNGEFIEKPEDIALFEDVEAKLWEYRRNGYLIFGITNQGGVAYGFKTQADVDAEINRTIELFVSNPFHVIKSCLHHPQGNTEPYSHRSLLRKPDIGMLVLCEIQAWEHGYIVDWSQSLLVGDREEDEKCANNASILYRHPNDFFDRNSNQGE
jgi:HAD-superfamily hydrolase, subfamily IIIA